MALALSVENVCTKCGESKSVEDFHKNNRSPDGRHPWCKVCKNSSAQARRERDPEYQRKYWQRWYAIPENREAHLTKTNAYFKTEKGRAVLVNSNAKRYIQQKLERSDITTDWLLELRKSTTHCPFCKVKLGGDDPYAPTYPNLDHITPLVIGGTHTMENVRYLCRKCNLSRPKNGKDI